MPTTSKPTQPSSPHAPWALVYKRENGKGQAKLAASSAPISVVTSSAASASLTVARTSVAPLVACLRCFHKPPTHEARKQPRTWQNISKANQNHQDCDGKSVVREKIGE